MLNKELIDYLSKFNPNAEIRVYDDYCEYEDIELSYITNEKSTNDKKEANYIFLKGTL